MRKMLCALVFCCTLNVTQADNVTPDESLYGIGFWQPATLGNHRAVIRVKEKSDKMQITLPWRRRDCDVENKGIVIIDASSGKEIHNFYRSDIRREYGTIIFQPQTVPGDYYVYYMPYETSGGPYPRISYPKEKTLPDSAWLKTIQKNMPEAQLIQFQSIDKFNSFYPMEIVATPDEQQQLLARHASEDFLLFAEDRAHPIKMFHDIPYRWYARGASQPFNAEADLNEYFVFQVGLWATQKDIKDLKISFSDLKNGKNTIQAQEFTCFNTEGTDWLQRKMQIDCNVEKGNIQPLWIGIQMPEKSPMGVYRGKITVSGENTQPQTIDISICLSDRFLTDKGDNDMYRLSRLRWLNSELACDNNLVKPYTPLSVKDKTIGCLGRSVTLNEFGFPSRISSYFTEEMTDIGENEMPVINAPIKFVIEQKNKDLKWNNLSFNFNKKTDGITSWNSSNKVGALQVDCNASMEFDGFMKYTVTIVADETTDVSDIRVEIPMNPAAAKYWLGMGQKGGTVPEKYNWKWNVDKNQEGFWLGTVNAGLHCVFRDENYSRPLNTNFYHSKPLVIPECWDNHGKGGITFGKSGNNLLVKAYSGSRTLKKGEKITYIFLASITPFKTIDTQKQWNDRYLHSYDPIDSVVAQGANTINIHHATAINPHINYPFFRPDYMKAYVDEAHEKGCKVKIYYTVRELANRAPELWALRSLGHEIFSEGKGNGYSWLQEHLDPDYIAAWFVEKYTDAAIVNTGVSRWHNFYVEGLNWLVQNVGIDGLYIDDLAIDRTTMKRIRKVLENGCEEPRIDLHSANQFNDKDGFINSACLYMEHMPYLDRLWLGEYFEYDAGPDYWLTEVSGIPYGMMGEMLQDCGNAWRGMIYGMTSRLHWQGCETAQYIWKAWDNFGIKESRMVGYWVTDNPIKTDNKNIPATCYIRDGKVMIALASWAPKNTNVKLNIDWEKLRIDPRTAKLSAPAIPLYQPAATFDPAKPIAVEAGKGWLLILE